MKLTVNEVETVDLDNLFPVLDDLIVQICTQKDIDTQDIQPSHWNFILCMINETLIKPNKQRLLMRDSYSYTHDPCKVEKLYMYYIYICMSYNNVISITGFTYFSGIDKDTLYYWDRVDRQGIALNYNNGVSYKPYNVIKNVYEDRKENILGRLMDQKTHPTKAIFALKSEYRQEYGEDVISLEDTQRKSLTAADLPRIGRRNKDDTNALPERARLIDIKDTVKINQE